MAKIEVNPILGSSQDNFLVFSNDNYERPYVTFYVESGRNPAGSIIIKDALNEDGYSKTIGYSPSPYEIISDSSFRVSIDNKDETTLSFLECLRKNMLFYNISIVSDTVNNRMVIKAYIESSTKYSITAGEMIVVGGNYSSYVPKEPNKFVLLLNDGDSQVTLEKHTIDDDISFNVTAPYEHMSFKNTFQLKMMAYHVEGNEVYPESISNNLVTVFPTTLTKFSDTSLNSFRLSYAGQKVNFLTNNHDRYYNYGEVCALSIMTDMVGVDFVKKYYTVSGKYLGEDTDRLYEEIHYMRDDYYFTCDIESIENSTNKQVGYIDVYGTLNGNICTNRVRYNVVPKCNQNNEIFFVNELGGIDSFNFLGERVYETKIKSQTTYFMNHTRKFESTKELEVIGQKVNNVEHTLRSAIVDKSTALWLNELSKSKYPFLYLSNRGTKFERIIITEMNIDVSDRENTFEIELTYQEGDNNIKL